MVVEWNCCKKYFEKKMDKLRMKDKARIALKCPMILKYIKYIPGTCGHGALLIVNQIKGCCSLVIIRG